MIRLVLYDASTGRIIGRLTTLANVLGYLGPYLLVGEDVTEQEWGLQPEMFFKVDIESKQLIDLDDIELHSAHGLKPDAILPTRPDMKARGRE